MARIQNRPIVAALVGCALLIGSVPAAAAAEMICGRPAAARVAVLRGERVVADFAVTLADTPALRRRGLMHCPSLAAGTGMLFTYPDARRRVFWMKHTAIALSIVFITEDDRIAAIETGRPQRLDRIHSPDGISAVLEINAVEGRPLAVGDRIRRLPPTEPPPSAPSD